jgi:hypothetical protein
MVYLRQLIDMHVSQVLVANADGSGEKLLYQGAEGAMFSGLSWVGRTTGWRCSRELWGRIPNC